MRRIQDVHKELLGLIEIRDAAGARRLMDDHVKMIRARRVSEQTTATVRPREAGTQSNERKRPLGSRFAGTNGFAINGEDFNCC